MVMGIGERAGDRLDDRDDIGDGKLALPLQLLAERLALHVGHGIIQVTLGLAGVVQRQNVRVIEPGGDLDLSEEPLIAQRGR
jgi:hypothetical protein